MTAMAHTAQLPVLNTGSLQSYLDSIQQIPVLSAEEEAELFQRFACLQESYRECLFLLRRRKEG